MSDINKPKEVNRRQFLKRMALLGGLAIGGAATLAACGDNTATATAIPTATAVPTATPAFATATPAPAKTTAPAATTKAAPKPTPAKAKPDPNFVEVGSLKDFEGVDSEPKLIDLPKTKKPMQVFIVKQGDTYSALSNICTHQGCEIDWVSADNLFECPCHGSQYDLDGNNVAGPAPLPLASYSAKVENGQLLVSVKKNN